MTVCFMPLMKFPKNIFPSHKQCAFWIYVKAIRAKFIQLLSRTRCYNKQISFFSLLLLVLSILPTKHAIQDLLLHLNLESFLTWYVDYACMTREKKNMKLTTFHTRKGNSEKVSTFTFSYVNNTKRRSNCTSFSTSRQSQFQFWRCCVQCWIHASENRIIAQQMLAYCTSHENQDESIAYGQGARNGL